MNFAANNDKDLAIQYWHRRFAHFNYDGLRQKKT